MVKSQRPRYALTERDPLTVGWARAFIGCEHIPARTAVATTKTILRFFVPLMINAFDYNHLYDIHQTYLAYFLPDWREFIRLEPLCSLPARSDTLPATAVEGVATEARARSTGSHDHVQKHQDAF